MLRGLELTADDVLRRDVIQALMCHFSVDFAAIESAHGISFGDYFAPELDGARRRWPPTGSSRSRRTRISVTSRGRLLVRTVAMVFDRYLRAQRAPARYSRVI